MEFNLIRRNKCDSIDNFILTARVSAHLLLHSLNNSSQNEDAYEKASTLEEEQKLPSEESHPVTDRLGENSRNPVKKQEKRVLRLNQIQ